MNRIIRYFKNIKLIQKNSNLFGYECPKCGPSLAMDGCDIPITAMSHHLWDNQYHMYKFYIKCKNCNFTTPAFPTLYEAENVWADDWALAEDNLLIKDDE